VVLINIVMLQKLPVDVFTVLLDV